MKLLITVVAFIILISGTVMPANINSVSDNSPVDKFGTLEINYSLGQTYSNPFDPSVIDVTVSITSPSSRTFTVKGFIYREYVRSGSTTSQTLSASGDLIWKARFTPDEQGTWSYSISAVDSGGTNNFGPAEFYTGNSASRGFVRISQKDPEYLAFDSGEVYYAIGQNIGWSSNYLNTYEMDAWLGGLENVGANFMRHWQAPWHTDIEWSYTYPSTVLGNYTSRMREAWALDYILKTCGEKGIYMMMCLVNHGKFSSTTNENWSSNPYNAANGGMLNNPQEVWTNAQAKELLKRQFRYIIARYGHYTSLMSWELWNEMEWTDSYSANVANSAAWHAEMASYIKENDPYKHPVTTSYAHSGSWPDDVWNTGMDIIQDHNYGGSDMAEVSRTMTKAMKDRFPGKPYIFGEMGLDAGGSGASIDPTGIHVYTSNWGSLMAKSAGGAMPWWWDNYIHPYNLYYRYRGVAAFSAGEDLDNKNYEPVSFDVATASISNLTVSPGNTAWGSKAAANLFTVAASGNVTPGTENMAAHLYGTWKPEFRNPPSFAVNYQTAGKFIINVGSVSTSGTNTIRVLLNGAATVLNYTAVAADTAYEINVPAGSHTIYVEHSGQDWFQVRSYVLTNYSTALRCRALSGDKKVLGWIQNRRFTYRDIYQGAVLNQISDAVVNLTGISDDGLYSVQWWNAQAGTVHSTASVNISGGSANLPVPPVTQDIAFKMMWSAQPATHTYTRTPTPSITQTVTPTVTGTPPTATATPTVTQSHTITPTFSITETHTITETFTNTPSITPTGTVTRTITVTRTPTITMTPTAAATEAVFRIKEASCWPNPHVKNSGSGVRVKFTLSRGAQSVNFRLYTFGWRLVEDYKIPGIFNAGENIIEVPSNRLNHTNGLYYWVINGVSDKGFAGKSETAVLIILK